MAEPTVTIIRLLVMQVCVPKTWSDEQIIFFANTENPSGTVGGWMIRKEGSEYAMGSPERATCDDHPENMHIVLEV